MSQPNQPQSKFQFKYKQSISPDLDKTPIQPKKKDLSLITSTETPNADAQTINKLNDSLIELIYNNSMYLLMELLKKISQDYGLPLEELQSKYIKYLKGLKLSDDMLQTPAQKDKLTIDDIKAVLLDDPTPGKSASIETDDKSNNEGVDHTKCYARTGGSKQCSRKKQKGQDFCGSHMHNQPNGRIDQIVESVKSQPKKRGRPPKNSPKSNINTDQPIATMDATMEKINGIEYIIDQNTGNIYKIPNDFNPENAIDREALILLGKKEDEQNFTWYSEYEKVQLRQS